MTPTRLPLPLQVAEQWTFPLTYHQDAAGDYWYAIPDWIKGLTQQADYLGVWSKMLPQLSLVIREMPYGSRGYPMDFTNDQGLYLVAQHLRSSKDRPLVKKIKAYLAKSGAFADMTRRTTNPTTAIDPDETLNAVIEEYRRRGKSDEWIDARLTGIMKRHQFTAALRSAIRDMEQGYYGTATNELYLGLWHRTAENLRIEMQLAPRANLRDHQPSLGLMYQGIAEQVAAHHLKARHELTMREGLKIVHEVATLIGQQATQTSQLMQTDLATGKRLLRA